MHNVIGNSLLLIKTKYFHSLYRADIVRTVGS
jgi:hypothetical protein